MNQKEKEAIIDKFLATKRSGHMLEIKLSFKGRDADAKKVKEKNGTLSKKIDNLLANIMKDWIDNTSAGVNEELKKINGKINDAVNEIKKDIKIAENIKKVLGYLDETIDFAIKLLA